LKAIGLRLLQVASVMAGVILIEKQPLKTFPRVVLATLYIPIAGFVLLVVAFFSAGSITDSWP
jgi:hypothetical protein